MKIGVRGAQVASDLHERSGSLLFNQGKKCWEACQELCVDSGILLQCGEWARRRLEGRRACRERSRRAGATGAGATASWRSAFEALVKTFLKSRHMRVERENLSRKRVLGREMFGAPDVLLPGRFHHGPIMGPRGAASKSPGTGYFFSYAPNLIDGGASADYISNSLGCNLPGSTK